MPYLIIGDAAYPLKPWLIKNFPFTSGITREQDSFNAYLNKGRVVVEMAFGRLKGRWRRLTKKIDVNVAYASQIIAAACTLHNIVEFNKENFPEQWLEVVRSGAATYPQPDLQQVRPENTNETDRDRGEAIRNALLEESKNLPPLTSIHWRLSRY